MSLLSASLHALPNHRVTLTNTILPQQAYKHMRSALALWPKDNLRPETQFSEIIQRGIERRYTKPNVVDEAKELKQANAMFALTDDRFKKRVSCTKTSRL